MSATRAFAILLLLAPITFAEDEKPKPKGKPSPKISASALEANALKCRTAKEALELYTETMPNLTESEREKARTKLQRWTDDSESGSVRIGKKWMSVEDADKLKAEADSLAEQAAKLVKTKKQKGMTPLLERAIKLYPEHVPSLCLLGYLASEQKNFTLAEKRFKEGIEIDAKQFECLQNLAICSALSGNSREAYRYFSDAAKINQADSRLATNFSVFSREVAAAAAGGNSKADALLSDIESLTKTLPNRGRSVTKSYEIAWLTPEQIIPPDPKKPSKPVE